MEKRVVLIRHRQGTFDDRVHHYFTDRGFEPEERYPFLGEALGMPDGRVIASVIYGGPFVVTETERYPFLVDEHRWAERCMAKGIPLLGICQGAQSIAHVLGAPVGPPPSGIHEFGYYAIHPTEAGRRYFPETLHVAQSHYHGFDLPAGAEHLAYSETYPHQAMRYGETTFAFQFHAEVTRAGFRRWQDSPSAAFGEPGAQTREQQDSLAETHDARQHDWFMGFLDHLFGHVASSAASPPGIKDKELC